MVLSEDGDDGQIETRFESLCMDLNMDRSSQEEAWQSFERIRTSYTLECQQSEFRNCSVVLDVQLADMNPSKQTAAMLKRLAEFTVERCYIKGDGLHWLACALYVSCRSSLVPAVHGRDMVEGNCVSLTRLLRSAKLSLIEFFKKMKKWADMASLPQKFRDKVERLERNFAVSTVTFKKFQPIFLDIFKNPADDPVRPPKGRKHKRHTIAAREVFSFCWTMFVQVKGNFPAISDDLVNSYHLLLCCIDWCYANALLSNRRDLLNPSFSGLPENFASRDYKPPAEVPCIIKTLCEEHQGLHLEAKGIKEHWWKPYIRKLFDKKMLVGKTENLMGVLELTSFEKNNKSINNAYDEYVLNGGDFDERVFLGDDANEEIGTPAKNGSSLVGETSERSQVARNLWQHMNEKTLAPATPLTNRRYLTEKEGMVTPVSTATQSVSRLQTLLSGRKTCPNEFLLDCFSKCSRNPKDGIVQRVVEMGKTFCEKYAQPCDSNAESVVDFAKRRLQLAESLYYKALENILVDEKQRHIAKDNFLSLLEQDIFHRSLFAICLEIVIFSYNSQRVFPWIVDVFEIPAYYFYKVIEVLIRAEEGLSRDIVKHLNHVEETTLESLVWRSDSPVWEAVKQSGDVPSVEEVSLPSQLERDGTALSNNLAALVSPPLVHPAVRRVATTDAILQNKQDALQSPGTISATDRFSSPVTAKRRLFPSTSATDVATHTVSRANSLVTTSSPVSIPMALITAQDGRQILIPVQVKPSPLKRKLEEPGDSNGSAGLPAKVSNSQPPNKPKRTGSLALFFRKVYHLASVRLRDLCDRLEIDSELCSKIWTCFEHSLINHIDLMQDRHLDQMIMCAVYVICKVTEKDRSFQDIMKCYRLQPQAESHVYRSVLLGSRQRYESGGSSSGSRNEGNRSGSPAVVERKGRKERENNLSSIRSSSTLPISQPSSQPPTPTRLAGTANTFQFDDRGEDRGDLIKFYNTIYVNQIKNYALKFSTQNVKDGVDKPILSPLPVVRSHCSSPRKISSNHSLYVSPHKAGTPLVTPQSGLLYCFNRSPARDLRAINNMIRMKDNGSVAKRLPLADEGVADCPPKRLMTTASPSGLTKRLEELMHDRQANGSS